MPCTYFDPPGTFCNEERDALTAKVNKYKKQLDLATKLLCDLCTNLEKLRQHSAKTETLIEDVPDLAEWWKKHNKMDAERVRAEGMVKVEKNISQLKLKARQIKKLGGTPGRALTESLTRAEKHLRALKKGGG